MPNRMLSAKKSHRLSSLYLVYIAISLFFLFPILWTLSLSLKTVPELYQIPPSLLPKTFAIENYFYLINQTKILRSLFNSVKITSGTIIGCMTISLLAAYCFSRISFRFKKQLMFMILMFQMISPLVAVVPLYRYYSKLHLLNSDIGLICIYIAISAPFQVWFLKGFLDTIPKELDEAATIDGCNKIQILFRILLPVVGPGLLSGILLVFISCWSQFIVPYIMITTPSKMPISVALVNLQSTFSQITTHYLAAASILAILPTILLFIFLQKYIISALTAGAVKG